MSSINSTSTLDEVKASYDDNCSYQEDSSPTKCAAFITAATMLLRRLPREATKEGQSLSLELDLIKQELRQARVWLATSSSSAAGGGVLYSDFSNFRQ